MAAEKKLLRSITAMVLALSMCLSLFGCSFGKEDPQQPETFSVTINGKLFEGYVSSDGKYYCLAPFYLAMYYQVSSVRDDYTLSFDYDDLGDLRDITLYATERTDKIAAVLSYFVWEDESRAESLSEVRAALEGWGLSEQNPLTGQWLEQNIDHAYEMIFIVPDQLLLTLAANADEKYEMYCSGDNNVSE